MMRYVLIAMLALAAVAFVIGYVNDRQARSPDEAMISSVYYVIGGFLVLAALVLSFVFWTLPVVTCC